MTEHGMDEETPESFKKKIYAEVYRQQKLLKFGCNASDIEHALGVLSRQIGSNYFTFAFRQGVEVRHAATSIQRHLPMLKQFSHKI